MMSLIWQCRIAAVAFLRLQRYIELFRVKGNAVLKVIWATGTRTGSNFLVQLTVKALGDIKYSNFDPGRTDMQNKNADPNFAFYAAKGRRMDYFIDHQIEGVKIEHCSNDLLLLELVSRFPHAKVMTVVRPLAQILESHSKIWKASQQSEKPRWMTPERALTLWINDITQLEYVKRIGRLLAVDLNDGSGFDKDKFLEFLGAEKSAAFDKFAENWPVVNDVDKQIKKIGGVDTGEAIGKHWWEAKLPLINTIERRYRKLLES